MSSYTITFIVPDNVENYIEAVLTKNEAGT